MRGHRTFGFPKDNLSIQHALWKQEIIQSQLVEEATQANSKNKIQTRSRKKHHEWAT